MDRSRLNELSYKAQLGETIEIDQFDLRELINGAGKVETVEECYTDQLSDIDDETKEIETAADKIKTLVFMARAQVEANKDDFDDCFTVVFFEILEQIEQKTKDIQSSNSEIERLCDGFEIRD